MDRRLAIKTDHLSILNRKLSTSTDIFFALGFVRGSGKTSLDENVLEMLVPTSRFVFDNAYIECVQFPPQVSEFYDYLNSPAGIHIMTLLTPDAEKFRCKLCENNIVVDELARATRKNIDYGSKKGTAVFLLVPMPYEIIKRTHVAFLEHRNRDLLYQPTRYPHINNVSTLEEVVICCRNEKEADDIEKELKKLCAMAENPLCKGGMKSVRLMDPVSIQKEYWLNVDLDRSTFAVVTFGSHDLSIIHGILKNSDFIFSVKPNRILVDLSENIGMVFEFLQI